MLPRAMSSTGKFTAVFCKLAEQPYSGTPLTRVLKQSGQVSAWEEGAPPGALEHSFGGTATVLSRREPEPRTWRRVRVLPWGVGLLPRSPLEVGVRSTLGGWQRGLCCTHRKRSEAATMLVGPPFFPVATWGTRSVWTC